MNILIVEDDAINQMLYGELMQEWNYDYDLASDGMEAIALAWKNQGRYDCCLMDINMPKLDGIEATQIIRKITHYFPILGLTANADYEKKCYEVGMDDFAVKPCCPDDLFTKINELTVNLSQ
jgi:CheY-like chemotaxis protein